MVHTKWVIPGFHRGVNEAFVCLECSTVLIGSCLPTFRDQQSVLKSARTTNQRCVTSQKIEDLPSTELTGKRR